MFDAGVLTFQEFAMQESLPLATLQGAILEFLRGRDDVAIFDAQAVNAYVSKARMTQDVDLLSPCAAALAEDVRGFLAERFHIAVRIREVGDGRGYRVFQVRMTGNRHLADVRPVASLPATQRIADVLVLAPVDLIASKVVSLQQRQGSPKSGTDWRDLAMLLLTFPDLKRDPGPVTDLLVASGASPIVLTAWREIAAQDIRVSDEDEEFE
ncbi:MAG: nucleotidyl transferase AbiEii/AbiGii toxin family protein [Anaerolineae bacterium]|nr:nucleotidyl transferase AbiEii/AbiGii toxin family protein [Anaerolineae bacterium]